VTVPGVVSRIQMFVPDGTAVPLAIGVVPAASENICPLSTADDGGGADACVTVTVNGPSACRWSPRRCSV
jgi:hypothetical protein